MPDVPGRPLRGEVLPPDARGPMQMPADTPLGLGFLGRARFDAIRRVLDARERAIRAYAANEDAQATLANAIVRKEQAFEQLRHLDSILDRDRTLIRRKQEEEDELAEIAKLRRELEKLELEERLALARTRSAPPTAEAPRATEAKKTPSDYEKIISFMRGIPNIVAEAKKAKEEIHRAGSGDEMSDADADVIAALDAIVQGFVAKGGEDAAL